MRLPAVKLSKNAKKILIYGGIGVIVLFLLLFWTGNSLVHNSSFCKRCHEMKASHDTWLATSHEKVDCYDCHQKPGFLGNVGSLLTLGGQTYAHFSGNYRKPISVDGGIKDKTCFQCHVTWREVSPGGDLIVPHDQHVKKLNIECNFCHNRIVHGWEREGEFKTNPPMQLCMRCHDGKKAPSECDRCHTEKAVPVNHKLANWPQDHGVISKTEDCKSCHGWTPDYCRDCHFSKRPTSHIEGARFRSLHGARAKERRAGCLVCHNDDFCQRCHDARQY